MVGLGRAGDWMAAVEKLRKQGKIRHFGISLGEHTPENGLRAVETGLVDTVQVITGEDIHRSGATSLPEALRLASNLEVAQVNSHDWAISARGFNNTLANKLLGFRIFWRRRRFRKLLRQLIEHVAFVWSHKRFFA